MIPLWIVSSYVVLPSAAALLPTADTLQNPVRPYQFAVQECSWLCLGCVQRSCGGSRCLFGDSRRLCGGFRRFQRFVEVLGGYNGCFVILKALWWFYEVLCLFYDVLWLFQKVPGGSLEVLGGCLVILGGTAVYLRGSVVCLGGSRLVLRAKHWDVFKDTDFVATLLTSPLTSWQHVFFI